MGGVNNTRRYERQSIVVLRKEKKNSHEILKKTRGGARKDTARRAYGRRATEATKIDDLEKYDARSTAGRDVSPPRTVTRGESHRKNRTISEYTRFEKEKEKKTENHDAPPDTHRGAALGKTPGARAGRNQPAAQPVDLIEPPSGAAEVSLTPGVAAQSALPAP